MKLSILANRIKKCRKCELWKNRKKTVPGTGPKNAKIFLIGLAPGEKENKTGKPFVGKAGKFLDKLLKKNKIDRRKVFLTSVLKCYLKDAVPKKRQIIACKPYLIEQIKTVKPEVVVLLGNVAKNVLYKNPILKERKVIVTYHPAAGMRFPKIRKKIEKDFKKIFSHKS